MPPPDIARREPSGGDPTAGGLVAGIGLAILLTGVAIVALGVPSETHHITLPPSPPARPPWP